jgi:N-acyl-L-homoserine lactone synthetase
MVAREHRAWLEHTATDTRPCAGPLPRAGRRTPTGAGNRRGAAPLYGARALGARETARLDEALRLRQAVFVHELSWVPDGRNGRERDRCDGIARHFAVFARPTLAQVGVAERRALLVAYARVLVAGECLMLQREFAELLVGERFAPDPGRAFEVSRFVVHPWYRGRLGADGRGAVEHLGRAIAGWARATGHTEWLGVCELRHVRALRLRGLPFTRFGQVYEYQPGVPVSATRLDLEQAADWLRARRPADHAWYTAKGPQR